MAIDEFNIDVNAVNNVGNSLSNVLNESQAIKSAANNIDAGLVSSFSPSAEGSAMGSAPAYHKKRPGRTSCCNNRSCRCSRA